MQKKGWIRVVEAFVAILLVVGVLLVVLDGDFLAGEDNVLEIHDSQLAVLRDIQVDDNLRGDILNSVTPVESDEAEFPSTVDDRISERIPSYLECLAKICGLNEICETQGLPEKSIYVQSVAITSTLTEYNPKQLKLFCWMKE